MLGDQGLINRNNAQNVRGMIMIKRDSLGRFVKGCKLGRKGKSYEEIYGVKKSAEIKEKLSSSGKGKKYPKGSYPNYGMRNKQHTERAKMKISKNSSYTQFKKGHKPFFYGYNDPEWKRKVSEGLKKSYKEGKWKVWSKGLTKKDNLSLREMSKKISEKYLGKDNPMWQGGISFEPYSPEFNKKLKQFVRQRDNFTCKLCSSKSKLSVHHIDYNKKNNIFANLILLCRGCNTKVNVNRESWKSYFENKLKGGLKNESKIVKEIKNMVTPTEKELRMSN